MLRSKKKEWLKNKERKMYMWATILEFCISIDFKWEYLAPAMRSKQMKHNGVQWLRDSRCEVWSAWGKVHTRNETEDDFDTVR